MKNKLSIYEAICLITIITISQIVLDYPEYIINSTGTGSLINLIFLGLISFIICIIISNIFKNFANSDIIDIAEFVGGNFLKFIVSILFIVFLIFSTILAISNFLYLIRSVYYSDISYLTLLAPFLIIMIISNYKGLNSIKKIIATFFPILFLSIIFLFVGNFKNINANNLFPVMGFNYKTTFLYGMQNIFIFNFMLLFFFIMPVLNKKNDYKKIVFISFFINLLLIIISIISLLLIYQVPINRSLTNINTINSIYTLTRKIQISDFLSQTDAIFIFFWCFGILAYISFLAFSINYILNKLFDFEEKRQLTFSVIAIILSGCLIINTLDLIKFLENNVFKYYSIILTYILSLIVLFLGYLKNKKNFKKGLK